MDFHNGKTNRTLLVLHRVKGHYFDDNRQIVLESLATARMLVLKPIPKSISGVANGRRVVGIDAKNIDERTRYIFRVFASVCKSVILLTSKSCSARR